MRCSIASAIHIGITIAIDMIAFRCISVPIKDIVFMLLLVDMNTFAGISSIWFDGLSDVQRIVRIIDTVVFIVRALVETLIIIVIIDMVIGLSIFNGCVNVARAFIAFATFSKYIAFFRARIICVNFIF